MLLPRYRIDHRAVRAQFHMGQYNDLRHKFPFLRTRRKRLRTILLALRDESCGASFQLGWPRCRLFVELAAGERAANALVHTAGGEFVGGCGKRLGRGFDRVDVVAPRA